MTRRIVVHKVGITSAVIGLASLFTLSFTILAPNRVVTGAGQTLLASVGPAWSLALVVGWVALTALSLAPASRFRSRAFARGVVAAALVLGTFALCGVAASQLIEQSGDYARVSIGGAAWVSAIAAYAVVLASRREVGAGSALGLVLAAAVPVGLALMVLAGAFSDLGMAREYQNIQSAFWGYVRNTILYSLAGLLVASVVGFGLGVLAFSTRRFEKPVFASVNVFQTIPGLAMIGLLFVPLAWTRQQVPLAEEAGIGGLGWAPVVIALTLYALLAITRNTYAGLKGVSPDTIEAGRGMGMTPTQIMWRVRVPLALPILFSGERTAAVQTVGNSTLGAFVAAFTLGTVIFGGLSQQALDLTMLGSIALVVIAVAADGLLRLAQSAFARRSHSAGVTRAAGVGEGQGVA